jgi:N-acetylglucosaminyl-diphospho-decaprenol L-rhamnosyltransferase
VAAVDVVVVTYRSGETVRGAIRPFVGKDSVRVIVVDNSSGDSTLDVLSTLPVETIALTENGGFAHGCNVGAAAGSSPYVLFLNPDAQIEPAAVEKLVDAMQADPRIGAVAPRIVEPDGSPDYSLRRFPRLRSTYAQALFLHRLFPDASWVDEVIREPSVYEQPGPIEWVSGACFLVRRTVLEQLGGLDEGFFHYSEDMDICARIWKAGYEVRYEPDAVAEHEGGGSAPRHGLLPILAASRIRYANKHDSRVVALLGRAGVALGSATHAVVSKGGWAARRGHLRSFAIALTPLPADPRRLIGNSRTPG